MCVESITPFVYVLVKVTNAFCWYFFGNARRNRECTQRFETIAMTLTPSTWIESKTKIESNSLKEEQNCNRETFHSVIFSRNTCLTYNYNFFHQQKNKMPKKQCISIEQCRNISKRLKFNIFQMYLHFSPQSALTANKTKIVFVYVPFIRWASEYSCHFFCIILCLLFGAKGTRMIKKNGTCCEIWYFQTNRIASFLHLFCLFRLSAEMLEPFSEFTFT